jgi:MFS family permease
MASGVYNSGFALGEVIGPIAGSLMAGSLGFRDSYVIVSGVFFVFLILLAYSFFCHKESITKSRTIRIKEDDPEGKYTPLLGIDERSKRLQEKDEFHLEKKNDNELN